MINVKFIDCVFEMPSDVTQPNRYLRDAAQSILTSSITSVTFNRAG